MIEISSMEYAFSNLNFEKAEKRWRERVCISLRDNVCRPDSGEH